VQLEGLQKTLVDLVLPSRVLFATRALNPFNHLCNVVRPK
jgi:hypothetical protein